MSAGVPTLPPEPARRLRRWHAWLVVWRLHRWLGLGGGALLVLLSATGSLLVVHHELEALFERRLHFAPETASPPQPPPTLAQVAADVAARAPAGHRLFRVLPARSPHATHKVVFLSADGTTRWSAFVAPATGQILWAGPDQRLLTPWLLGLHMQLHAGRAGYWITGAGGVALTLLALTGLHLHRGRLAALLRRPFRLRLGWRVALADLHQWVGLAALYFPLVLGITGTIYAVVSLGSTPAASRSPVDPARLPPLEPMIAAARSQFPAAEVLRIQFPAHPRDAATVLLLHRAHPPWQKFSSVSFDLADGRLRTVRDATRLPAAEQLRSMLAPLHFGFHGATWVKWAYFLGGLAPAALAFTGAALWWARTHRGARRTPRSAQAHAAAAATPSIPKGVA